MAWVSSGIPVLATSHRTVPASHAQIKLSREPRYPPSLESGILGVRPCGGVRSALILDPAIDAPSLTGPMGAGSVSDRCKITPLYSSAACTAFRGIERGFRPDRRRRGIALRTASAGYQAEPVGDELLPPQDDQAKDVAMMEMVIPVSSAMSWARVIE